jgi:AcrR family transcriptional regulator
MMKEHSSRSADPGSDERVRRSKEAVLAAANELLSETGFGGVSVDAVSKRSGVAKTTIYRHWPSRTALLLEACAKLGSRPEAPDTGSLRGDLTALAMYLAHQLRSACWATVLPSIIDAAERDPEIAELQACLHAGFLAPFRTVVERAKGRGELSPSQDPSEVIASIAGPLFFRRWFSREALDESFVSGVVERAVNWSKQQP